MSERVEPIRRRVEPVPRVERRRERDPYEERRERPKRSREPEPADPGEGHVDVRA